jgi:hypothetical protein
VQFPDQKVVLGQYLGPTEPEIGSVLTVKILTISGEILHWNTIQHLTDEEKKSKENRKERDLFDETFGRRCGVPFKETELGPSLGLYVSRVGGRGGESKITNSYLKNHFTWFCHKTK